MNIFVGNLSFEATEADVKKLFEGFGNVTSVVIVMRKEKKVPKSRGFGFVQMPDEQQALAAMVAFNGKEFMGRVLNVNLARPNPRGVALPIPIKEGANPRGVALPIPIKEGAKEGAKTEAERKSELKKKMQPKVKVEAEQYPQEEREQKKAWINPVFNKYPALTDRRVRPSGQHPALKDGRVRPSGQHLALKDGRVRPSGQHLALEDGQVRPSGRPGTYRGGRRTRSYISRRGLAGMQEETKPRQRSQDNPMRWRKRGDQPKPWQRIPGEHKPWKKPAGDAKPWSKSSRRPQKSGRL